MMLGLDLSFTCPGFAVIDAVNRKPVIVELAHNKNKANHKARGEVLDEAAKIIDDILTKHPEIDTVVREHVVNTRFTAGQAIIGMVGVSDLQLWRSNENLTVAELYPSTIKKLIGGSGRADKQAVADGVRRYVGDVKFVTDDESDAAAAALAYALREGLIDYIVDESGKEAADETSSKARKRADSGNSKPHPRMRSKVPNSAGRAKRA